MRKTQMIMNKPVDLSNVCMNFGKSMRNQNMVKMEDFVIWI